MVTLWPAGSTQPVAESGEVALGAAATQMVSAMWLTNVTRRWPAAPEGGGGSTEAAGSVGEGDASGAVLAEVFGVADAPGWADAPGVPADREALAPALRDSALPVLALPAVDPPGLAPMVAVAALAAVRGAARVAAVPPVPVPSAAQPAVSANTASTAAARTVAARTVVASTVAASVPRRPPHPRPRFAPNIVRITPCLCSLSYRRRRQRRRITEIAWERKNWHPDFPLCAGRRGVS